jgi:hypothetical protein
MTARTWRGIGAVLVLWATAVTITRQLAPRLDRGDESSSEIRRAVVAGELRLPDLGPHVRRVHVDLAMAGAEIGWPRTDSADGSARRDVTVHAKMAGLQVTVPAGTTVWWRSRGPGGVSLARQSTLTRVSSPDDAELRVDAVLVFAGVTIVSA